MLLKSSDQPTFQRLYEIGIVTMRAKEAKRDQMAQEQLTLARNARSPMSPKSRRLTASRVRPRIVCHAARVLNVVQVTPAYERMYEQGKQQERARALPLEERRARSASPRPMSPLQ